MSCVIGLKGLGENPTYDSKNPDASANAAGLFFRSSSTEGKKHMHDPRAYNNEGRRPQPIFAVPDTVSLKEPRSTRKRLDTSSQKIRWQNPPFKDARTYQIWRADMAEEPRSGLRTTARIISAAENRRGYDNFHFLDIEHDQLDTAVGILPLGLWLAPGDTVEISGVPTCGTASDQLLSFPNTSCFWTPLTPDRFQWRCTGCRSICQRPFADIIS